MIKTERALHILYSKSNEGGEFYKFEPELIIPLLGLMGKDITNSFEQVVEEELTPIQRSAEATEARVEANKYAALEGAVFHLRNLEVQMIIKDGKFIVKKDSFAKLESAECLQYGTYKRIFDKRNALVAEGKFLLEVDKHRITEDIIFDNPSFAVSVILGSSVSRDAWLSSDNKSFNEVLKGLRG